VYCSVDSTTISENGRGAIFLDRLSKDMLSFKDEKKARDMIEGSIGGEWGNIFPVKKKSCSGGTCSLL
jgi:hypothetical protein